MKGAPWGGIAVTGSHLSATAKTTRRTTPLTNSGMTVIDSEQIVIARSRTLSRCRPAYTPTRMDVGTMITSAKPASRSELPSASITYREDGHIEH